MKYRPAIICKYYKISDIFQVKIPDIFQATISGHNYHFPGQNLYQNGIKDSSA